jgi:hypothetical protein
MSLSNQFEIAIIDAAQPIAGGWFGRWKRRHVRIVNDLIKSDDTHRPAGKAVPDMTVIVYSVGKEFLLTAEYPISFVTVPDAERLIEPALSFKGTDKVLKSILWHRVPYLDFLVVHFCQEK